MEIEAAYNNYIEAKNEWLKYLTFTGVKSECGLIAYAEMVKAGEIWEALVFTTS